MAATIEGLADHQNGTAVSLGLLTQQLNRESKRIEYRGSVISKAYVMDGQRRSTILHVMLPRATGREGPDRGRRLIDVRSKILQQRGVAVESNHCNFVRNVPDNGFEHGSQRRSDGAVLVELTRTCPAHFDDNHQRQRLCVSVLVEGELLLNAVIGDAEVICLEGEDEFSAGSSNQGRNQHDRRF